MPRAPLAAAFVAACLITPAASQDADCPIGALNADQQPVPTVPVGSPTCRAALRMGTLYARLSGGANRLLAELKAKPEGRAIELFAPREPAFKLLLVEAGANAYYSATDRSVLVNPDFVERYTPESTAALWALAHELGHAVQHRTGTSRGWADTPEHTRRYEAQADALAIQILQRAGYSARDELRAKEAFFGCGTIKAGGAPTVEHADSRTRWINSLVVAKALKARGGAATEGALRSSAGRIGGAAVDGRDAQLETLFDSARSAPAAPAAPSQSVHAIRMSDFDAKGAVNPRALRERGRDAPPKPGAARAAAPAPGNWIDRAAASWNVATDAIADVWDSWWFHPRLQALAAKACGAPEVDTYGGAVAVGLSRTIRDAAASAAKAVWPPSADAGR